MNYQEITKLRTYLTELCDIKDRKGRYEEVLNLTKSQKSEMFHCQLGVLGWLPLEVIIDKSTIEDLHNKVIGSISQAELEKMNEIFVFFKEVFKNELYDLFEKETNHYQKPN